MKVILLEDIAQLGKKYDTVEVADGYGMNYLIPQGKARTATDKVQAKLKKEKERLEEKRKARRQEIAEELSKIDGSTVTLTRKAGDHGQLFAGVDAEDLADEIQRELDIALEADYIQIEQPIKKVGTHEVSVVVEDETATLEIEIEGA